MDVTEMRAKISAVLTETDRKGFSLNCQGNAAARNSEDTPFQERVEGYDLENIERAMGQVNILWQKTENARGSLTKTVYGMKHDLENTRKLLEGKGCNGYITSGDFTMAMLLCDYKIKPSTKTDFNVRLLAKETRGYKAYNDAKFYKTCTFLTASRHRDQQTRLGAEWAEKQKNTE